MPTYAPPSDTMAIFIQAVRNRLRKLRVSQNELARRMGKEQTDLSKLLRGVRGNCSLETCDQIAHALGTTTLELLQNADRSD